MIAEKLGVEDMFCLYENQLGTERRILDTEKPVDITANWKLTKKDKDSKFIVKQQQTAIGNFAISIKFLLISILR